MYLPLRHNEVAKCLHHAIIRSVDPAAPFRSPESVAYVGGREIWRDMRVRKSPKVQHYKTGYVDMESTTEGMHGC